MKKSLQLSLVVVILSFGMGGGFAEDRANSSTKVHLKITLSDEFVVFNKEQQTENVSSLGIAIRHADVMETALEGTYKSLAGWALNSAYPEVRLKAICAISQQIYCGLKYYDEPWDGLSAARRQEIKSNPQNFAIPSDLQPGKQEFAIHYLGEVARLSTDPSIRNVAVDMLTHTMRFNRAKYKFMPWSTRDPAWEKTYKPKQRAVEAYDSAILAEDTLVGVYQGLEGRRNAAKKRDEVKALQSSMDQIRMALNGTAENDSEPSIKTHITDKMRSVPSLAIGVASALQSN